MISPLTIKEEDSGNIEYSIPWTCSRWIAVIVYIFPAVYGMIIFAAAASERSSAVFISTCVALGTICILTSVVGEVSTIKNYDSTLRATSVLMVVENAIMMITALFLIFELIGDQRKHFHRHKGDLLKEKLLSPSVGYPVAIFLMVCVLLTFICFPWITEYLVEIEAAKYSEETAALIDREWQAYYTRKSDEV